MGRRWVVQVDTTPDGAALYLRRYKTLPALDGSPRIEELPVTYPFATRFLTKREGLALAESRGFANAEAMHTW